MTAKRAALLRAIELLAKQDRGVPLTASEQNELDAARVEISQPITGVARAHMLYRYGTPALRLKIEQENEDDF